MRTRERPGPGRRPARTGRTGWAAGLAVVLAGTVSLTGAAACASVTSDAPVHDSCTVSRSRCADARSASSIWASKGYPTRPGWYPWPGGTYNYTGGRFQNREGRLPRGATYDEYDVYSRPRGAARDAYRIVVDRSTRVTWFTPDHYTDFYRL
ncbi:ribonuclease domain-containing protein [Nonomuraea roseoviolacea]|uniref:Guanyl-specific ribonuclease Sa n=1 Tax=Nonomuraea roseoviolacea subsp. carminata TaxID=160689 RepID=A0ABT1K7C4_9ACTN|nr:ribonuclease domain-containing protein [Nonomuraea roseoviolacea]MCP2349898.1 guanyl-specific ribonuclease Sa [Nonomuraea roseoviolacea subsp. carminata]